MQLTLLPPDQITPDELNAKAAELGKEGAKLAQTAAKMVEIAIDLGGMLEAKAAQVERAGGSWLKWQEAHLSFSRQSADNYSRLYRRRDEISEALQGGMVSSLRQALAILSKEPGLETPLLPGIDLLPASGKAAPQIGSYFKSFWRAIAKHPPETWGEGEKSEFLIDLAERERIRKEKGWELPASV